MVDGQVGNFSQALPRNQAYADILQSRAASMSTLQIKSLPLFSLLFLQSPQLDIFFSHGEYLAIDSSIYIEGAYNDARRNKSWKTTGLHAFCAVLFTVGYAMREYGAFNYMNADSSKQPLMVNIMSQVFLYVCP